MDVADLFQLEAALQREGVVEPPPDEETALGVHEQAGQVLNVLTVGQAGLDDLGGVLEPGGVPAGFGLGPAAPGIGQTEGEEIEHAHLNHIGLGGGHRNLGARVGVHHIIRRPGDGAAHHVDDGQHRHPPALGQLEGCQSVAGLPRLADDDDQILRAEDGIPVAELAGDVHLRWDPGQGLDGRLAYPSGVHGGTAGHQMNPTNLPQRLVGELGHPEHRHPVLHPGADGGGDGGGLLVDLLEHKMGVAALLGGFDIPVRRQDGPLDRLAEFIVERKALRLADDDVPFFQDTVFLGVFQQGGDIRGHKVLPLPIAHDEGALPPDGEDGVRVIAEEDGQGIAAPHLGQSFHQGFQRVALVAAVDQLDQDLGVGLALKGIAPGGEHLLQGAIILDDAVVNNAHLGGGVGMAVHIAGLPVGGPPGMPDAAAAGGQLGLAQLFLQGRQAAFALDDPNPAPYGQSDAGRVIAPIFQFGQTIQQHILGRTFAHIAYNATHTKHLHAGSRPGPPVRRSASLKYILLHGLL